MVIESSPIRCLRGNKPGIIPDFRRQGSIGGSIIKIIWWHIITLVMAVGAPETCICNALVQGVTRLDIRDVSKRICIMKLFSVAIIAGTNLAVPVSGRCASPQSSGNRIRTGIQCRNKARRVCKIYYAVPQEAGSAVRSREQKSEERGRQPEIMTIPTTCAVYTAICSIRKQIFYIMDI